MTEDEERLLFYSAIGEGITEWTHVEDYLYMILERCLRPTNHELVAAALYAVDADVAPNSYPVALRVWQLPSCTVGATGQGAEPSASAAPWPDCGKRFAA
jgi:hypothetical protein